jgi:predicted nucleic acid-binding protein
VGREDEPHNRILECAVEAASEFILTADNDLLRLGSYSGIQIMKAADFLQTRVYPIS